MLASEKIARYVSTSGKTQTVFDHLARVARLASENSDDLPFLKSACFLTGILHDAGKFRQRFQDYLENVANNPSFVPAGGKIDHSFAGGRIATELANSNCRRETFLAEMIRHAVLCHHGLQDCVSPELEIYYEKRLIRETNSPDGDVRDDLFQLVSKDELQSLLRDSKAEIDVFLRQVADLIRAGNDSLGKCSFYYGMCERLLASYLVDADRTDAACFATGRAPSTNKTDAELEVFWNELSRRLDGRVAKFPLTTELNRRRAKISDECYSASQKTERLFRFVAPTGSGKTLAALRFAFHCAKTFRKRRIFYIAPFNSILEQNAEVIRGTIRNPATGEEPDGVLLEHHCNAVQDPKQEEGDRAETRRLLMENWDCPIVATSAVQFLNALFSSSLNDVRRTRALVNSVIVVDEVQAIPIRCQSLFNLATNFLTTFCRSTVVLCSATQPPLEYLPQRLRTPTSIVDDPSDDFFAFKRTRILDATRVGGYSVDDLVQFAFERLQELGDSADAL